MKRLLTDYALLPIFGLILGFVFLGCGLVNAQMLSEYNLIKTATFLVYSGDDSLAMVPSAIDAQGCVVVAGANKVTAGEGTNIVIKKYNRKLEELWSKEWNSGSNNDDYALDVLTDDSCNVYVTGYTRDSIDPYFQRLVAIKYNCSGVKQWEYLLGGLADAPLAFVHGMRLALDGNQLYIVGASHYGFFPYQYARFQDVTSYDSCGLTAAMVLIKLQSNGTEDWKVNYQPPGWPATTDASYPGGIVFANNHIYVCAQMRNDTLDNDLVVYKYTTGGVEQWMRHYSQEISGTYEHPLRMTSDPAGSVYITGLTKSNDSTDYLVVQYEADGTLGWALTYDEPEGDNHWSNDIVYKDNCVLVTGQSNYDVVTIKIQTSDGTPVWVNRWEGSGDTLNWHDRPYGVVVDDSGTVFVGGYTSPGNLLADTTRFFMIQYSSDGTQQARYTYHSGNVTPLYLPAFIYKGIARDTSGYMYMIAGYKEGGLTDPVEWQLLKLGDMIRLARSFSDTIVERNNQIAQTLALVFENRDLTVNIQNFVRSDTLYAKRISDIMIAFPALKDSIRAYALLHSLNMTEIEDCLAMFESYSLGEDMVYYPKLFALSPVLADSSAFCDPEMPRFIYAYSVIEGEVTQHRAYKGGNIVMNLSAIINTHRIEMPALFLRGEIETSDGGKYDIDGFDQREAGCTAVCYQNFYTCKDQCTRDVYSQNRWDIPGWDKCLAENCEPAIQACLNDCKATYLDGVVSGVSKVLKL
ncbi:MAG: hypothetical protein KF690_07010 [Bacteroidetes bacterium]|nr:hypothetical protein [Bacteroidota bacterium]